MTFEFQPPDTVLHYLVPATLPFPHLAPTAILFLSRCSAQGKLFSAGCSLGPCTACFSPLHLGICSKASFSERPGLSTATKTVPLSLSPFACATCLCSAYLYLTWYPRSIFLCFIEGMALLSLAYFSTCGKDQ